MQLFLIKDGERDSAKKKTVADSPFILNIFKNLLLILGLDLSTLLGVYLQNHPDAMTTIPIHYIQAAIDTFNSIPGAAELARKGCTEEEIAILESHIRGGYRLPAAYREFLQYAGHDWGKVFQTKNFPYRVALVYNKSPKNSWSSRLFPDMDAPRFPEKVFLFEDWLGANFMYFNLDEGDDPPVYLWDESMDTFEEARIEAPSFTVYLHTIVGWTKYFALQEKGMRLGG